MPEIRRILVAIEPDVLQSQAPELATRLAAAASAELEALLIEDTALLAAANLPFTREVLTPTGANRALTLDDLELGFQVLAQQARRRLERLAGPSGLRWSLRSVRGDPGAQLAAAATNTDLLVLGQPFGVPRALQSMRQIAQRVNRPIVFLGDSAPREPGIVVLADEDGIDVDLLAIATSLARWLSGNMTAYRASTAGPDAEQVIAMLAPGAADMPRQAVLVVPRRR